MANVRSYSRICLVLIVFLISFLTFSYRKQPPSYHFNKVVVFGDSFSDTGNAYRLKSYVASIVSHFSQDRYCDGLIWVDRLKVPEKYSYAVGGAVTDNGLVQNSTKSGEILKPGVRQQIVIYLDDARKINFDVTLPLYITWTGFNDFRLVPSVDPKLIVNNLINTIQDLLAVGAKNFLIFNEAPFQSFPYYQDHNKSEFYTQLTDSFNKELRESLATLQKNQQKTSIYMFDNHALITKIISKRPSTTSSSTIQGCLIDHNNQSTEKFCGNLEQFVFYDEVHFSSSVHQLIANAIQPFLSLGFEKTTSDSYIHCF